ncbi:MAG: hypothetical protein JW839_15325 [Candidatus Lokiarchaeota archaeon]|nr:hypothetical protein [Candidatus Lokiarchaeota archaeon]
MTMVKAISSDETFQEWLSHADLKTLEKFFKKKKVDFKRELVSAVETVQGVDKFVVIYFEKDVKAALAGKQSQRTEQVNSKDIERTRFFDFGGKQVSVESWKGDKEVPMYQTIKEVKCAKCGGQGSVKCKSCGGAGKVACGTCDGKAKITCKACKGTKAVELEIEILDGEGKKYRAKRRVPCGECHAVGSYNCPDCSATGKVRCKSCDSSGVSSCDACKGTGTMYEYAVQPVPFIMSKKDAEVYYSKDVEKFIDKQSVEEMLNARDIQGIVITNPDDLKENVLKPQLNYWTKDADKVCNDAKKDYKDYVKKSVVKEGTKILVLPAIQLACKGVSGKDFQVFGIGVEGNFIVLDARFD